MRSTEDGFGISDGCAASPHSGRQPHRGMEGLAISPNGTKLYGAMQSALIQDGEVNEKTV